MRPVAGRVRPKPAGSGSVAILAGNALGNFEGPPALVRCGVQRVADEAFRRFFRFASELQNAGHALSHLARERLIGAAVLVLQNPGGVLGLQDAAVRNGFHAAVTARCGARSRSDVLNGLLGRRSGAPRLSALRAVHEEYKQSQHTQSQVCAQSVGPFEHSSGRKNRILSLISLALREVNGCGCLFRRMPPKAKEALFTGTFPLSSMQRTLHSIPRRAIRLESAGALSCEIRRRDL